jgi:hypothetical protein
MDYRARDKIQEQLDGIKASLIVCVETHQRLMRKSSKERPDNAFYTT